MVKFDTKKRYVIIIFVLTFIIGIIFINALVDKTKEWHSANDILISINSSEITLQEAIDNNMFIGLPKLNQPYTQPIPDSGHSSDRIWISVNNSEITLQEAISTIGLCGNSITNSYNNDINPGHLASEIEVSVHGSMMSLQDAIDSGELVSVDGGWTAWSSWSACSVQCGGGNQTRTRTCTNPSQYCAGANCVGLDTETQNCNTQSCCQSGSFNTWSGTCTNFCLSRYCNTAQVYGVHGSSLRGCSTCWSGALSGPYGGSYTDCSIIQSGWIPICATQCRCTDFCTPDCTGKECGDDGCGGSCGTCWQSACWAAADGYNIIASYGTFEQCASAGYSVGVECSSINDAVVCNKIFATMTDCGYVCPL